MKDFIGHEVNIGDYIIVTYNNSLSIRKIVGIEQDSDGYFVEIEEIENKWNHCNYYYSDQIAWIDPKQAMISILEK